MNLQKQVTVFGDYTDVDLAALGASGGKLSFGYSHPAMLSFTVTAAEHTIPIERLAFVRLWSPGATLDDGETEQSADAPLFEGFVEQLGPGGDANKVNVVCYDPTYRVGLEVTVMSAAYQAGFADPDPDLQEPPTEGIGAVPRLVVNAIAEGDEDYAANVAQGLTIGSIIAGILALTQQMLWWRNCSPGTLLTGAQQPFDADDMTAMSFISAEKIVWESESVRNAVERLQRYEPRCKLQWEPGVRLWRFRDITAAPEVTLRLNDPTIDFPVLSLELTPSLDRCYTALKIYGPETSTTAEFIWYDPAVAPEDWTNTLVPVGDPIQLELVGLESIVTYRGWQIVDTTQRRGARLLPDWISLRTSEYIWENTHEPQCLLSWDGGRSWTGAAGVWLDYLNGMANFPQTLPYVTVEQQYGQSTIVNGQHYFPPNAVKLVWAPRVAPLSVRVPETGFSGTAFDLAGLQLERKVYDEQLAIGVEYGTPVTSAARIAQMTELANAQLTKAQDIVWVGGCVLDGLDYSWCRLNRRVCFSANDGNGGTLTTGWEAIHAYVTDAEYDFTEQTTTLTFSSDRAELFGEDISQIKQRLHIHALEQVAYEEVHNLWRTMTNWRGETYQELAGLQITSGFDYVDPETGRTVAST